MSRDSLSFEPKDEALRLAQLDLINGPIKVRNPAAEPGGTGDLPVAPTQGSEHGRHDVGASGSSPGNQEADSNTIEMDFSHPFHWAAFQLIGDWQ